MESITAVQTGTTADQGKDGAWSTAELHDRYMEDAAVRLQVARPGLVSFGGRRSYCGRISTVVGIDGVPPRLRDVLAEPGQGRVLVVEGDGTAAQWALLGDRLGALALSNDWAGILIHGYVRDVAALRTLSLGVHASGSIPSRPRWADSIPITRDIPLHFHGVDFHPGHWLFADEDGLLVAQHDLTR